MLVVGKIKSNRIAYWLGMLAMLAPLIVSAQTTAQITDQASAQSSAQSSAQQMGQVLEQSIAQANEQSVGMAAQVIGSTKFADPSLSAASMPSPMGSVAQSMFGLLVVLGVLFGLTWLMRRYKWARASAAGLQVVQGISLGQKERAVIVRVQGRQLLLGVAPGQVTLLTELDAAVDAAVTTDPVPADSDPTSFKAVLKRSLGIQSPSQLTDAAATGRSPDKSNGHGVAP